MGTARAFRCRDCPCHAAPAHERRSLLSSRLDQILDFRAAGQPVSDAHSFLERFGAFTAVAHEQRVSYAVVRLAIQNSVNRRQAELGAWLHDLSAVIPNDERTEACRQLNVELLPVETQHPVLSHAKLSRALAELILNVRDRAVLDAVQFHTTLRAGAAALEKVVFLADKMECDDSARAKHFGGAIQAGLAQSLDAGCLAYLQYVVDNAERLGWPVHPDLSAAHAELAPVVAAAPPPPREAPPVKETRQARPKREKPTRAPRYNITGPLVARPTGAPDRGSK